MGLSSLRNLGPRSEQWLLAAGITTQEDLEELGSVEAFLRVREVVPEVSAVLLYALEGALRDERWDLLPARLRTELAQQAAAE